MQTAIVAIFYHLDNFLKALSWRDDPQCRLSLAEVATIGLTASRFFAGNIESARAFLVEHGYVPSIGKSRLNRRLHAIPAFFWHLLVAHLATKQHPENAIFLVDSFPVSVCHLVRSSRRSLFQGKQHVGYNASKQAWFTGLKVHMLVTMRGQPKEFLISPGSTHDLKALQNMYLGTIPRGTTIFGDKAYTSKQFEEELLRDRGVLLVAERRANAKRGQSFLYQRYGKRMRKRIETSFSAMTSWLPRHIHAVTNQGFVLKLMLLVTAFSLSFLNF